MNRITRRKYTLEFDVWEPFEKIADQEVDSIVAFSRAALQHVAHAKFTPEPEVTIQ